MSRLLRWLAAKYNIIIEEKELSEHEKQEKSEQGKYADRDQLCRRIFRTAIVAYR